MNSPRTSALEHTNLGGFKAHVPIAGNELTDRLAKTAANDKDRKATFSPVHIDALMNQIKEQMTQPSQKQWKQCTKPEITKKKVFPNNTRHKN